MSTSILSFHLFPSFPSSLSSPLIRICFPFLPPSAGLCPSLSSPSLYSSLALMAHMSTSTCCQTSPSLSLHHFSSLAQPSLTCFPLLLPPSSSPLSPSQAEVFPSTVPPALDKLRHISSTEESTMTQ